MGQEGNMTEENKKIYMVDNTVLTEEYVGYLFANQIEVKNLEMSEHLGLFCRMNDVVSITNMHDKKISYVAPGDEYEPYYYVLKYPGDKWPWRDQKGSLKHIYNALENSGIKLSTTMYKDIKNDQKVYKK